MEESEAVNDIQENDEDKGNGVDKTDTNNENTTTEKQDNVQPGDTDDSKPGKDGDPGEEEVANEETIKEKHDETKQQEGEEVDRTEDDEEEMSEYNEIVGSENVWDEEMEEGEEGEFEELMIGEEEEEVTDEFMTEAAEEEELEEEVMLEEEDFEQEFEELEGDEEKLEEEKEGEEEEEEVETEEEEDEHELSEEAESIDEERKQHKAKKRKKIKVKKMISKEMLKDEKEEEHETSKMSFETASTEEESESISLHTTPSEKLFQQEREELFQQLNSLRADKVTIKTRNIMLHRKLVNHFRKRLIDQPFHEFRPSADLENRYHKKLLTYQEFSKVLLEDRQKIIAEWDVLGGCLQGISKDFEELLQESEQKLLSLKNKLIVASTGKVLDEQIVEDSIKQSGLPYERLIGTRLTYIKLKNLVARKIGERNMNHIGSDFHMTDYEQLIMQKEEFGDKIVERDLEIATVEKKVKELKQRLGGIKLQLDALEKEIEDNYATLNSLDIAVIKIREEINVLKEKRHLMLEDIYNMKHNSGLITYPELLDDYKETQYLVDKLSERLELLKETYKSHQIQTIMANRENNILNYRFSVMPLK